MWAEGATKTDTPAADRWRWTTGSWVPKQMAAHGYAAPTPHARRSAQLPERLRATRGGHSLAVASKRLGHSSASVPWNWLIPRPLPDDAKHLDGTFGGTVRVLRL